MINDLKDFEKMLKICRRQGVTEFSFGQLSVKIGDLPIEQKENDSDAEIPGDSLTSEQMAFYAVS